MPACSSHGRVERETGALLTEATCQHQGRIEGEEGAAALTWPGQHCFCFTLRGAEVGVRGVAGADGFVRPWSVFALPPAPPPPLPRSVGARYCTHALVGVACEMKTFLWYWGKE